MATPTSRHTRTRSAAALVALAPVVLLAAFLAHPFLRRLPDAAAVADAVAAGTTRWAVVHLATAVASGLVAAAFVVLGARLRDAGDVAGSSWGLPFVVFGSVLYGFLPGLELAPLAAVETGGDVQAVQAALQPYFVAAFVTSVITFAIGIYGFVRGITATAILTQGTQQLVVTGLIVMAVARAVPLGAVQFYVQALAALVALWPLALDLWRQPIPDLRSRSRSAMPAA